MASSRLPTPRPDENLVLVIEIQSPEESPDSKVYQDFDARFSRFKQELDALITQNFQGSLKMKVLMKKAQQSSIVFNNPPAR
jgi:hypothetical protein